MSDMKRWKPYVAIGALSLVVMAGCATTAEGGDAPPSRVALMLPGVLGSGGFLDQAAAGATEGAERAGWQAQVIEAGDDPSRWSPALLDMAAEDNDLLITGTFSVQDVVGSVAAANPDKSFVFFDGAIDPTACECANVYSMTYRNAEVGFLAGALAGLLETSQGVENIHNSGKVGVVLGQEIPLLQDYLRGFIAGVHEVAPDVEVLSAYVGSFADPVKSKAIASDLIAQGAGLLTTGSGGGDIGVFEAAGDAGIWAFGNSVQQSQDPVVGGRDVVLTSTFVDVSASIAEAIEMAARDELPLGEVRTFGVKEGAIHVDRTELFERVVPTAAKERLEQIITGMSNGEYEAELPR